jgi:magnesium transporter
MLDAYLQALDTLQEEIDGIEEAILRDEAEDLALQRLVSLRRRVGLLRSRLSPHRRVFATLGHPSVGVHEAVGSPDAFAAVNDRLELAMQAVETTREMVVGAFDLYMTQTAQHTNDIVQVLTTMSVLLLPTALISAILGMDMVPAWLRQGWVFWASLVLMTCVSAGLLWLMKRRRWM